MTRADKGTAAWSVQCCIRALGVETVAAVCSEGRDNPLSTSAVYRWSAQSDALEIPIAQAMRLHREMFVREGWSPFSELFAAPSGCPKCAQVRAIMEAAQ